MLSRPARARIARKEATSSIHNVMPKLPLKTPLKSEPVKRTGGCRDTHGTHTGHAGAQGHTDHTDEPHNHPNTSNTQPACQHEPRRPKPQPRQPTQQPQARSRPLPAAESEEAAPSEPDPASTRSQSASELYCTVLTPATGGAGTHGRTGMPEVPEFCSGKLNVQEVRRSRRGPPYPPRATPHHRLKVRGLRCSTADPPSTQVLSRVSLVGATHNQGS